MRNPDGLFLKIVDLNELLLRRFFERQFGTTYFNCEAPGLCGIDDVLDWTTESDDQIKYDDRPNQ